MKLVVMLATAGLLLPAAVFAQTTPAPALPPASVPLQTSAQPASADTQYQAMFATVLPTDRLSSEIIGLDVYNNANEDIGTIKDIAYAGASVKAYIVAVGGFLGVGDHYVAISPSDLTVAYDTTAKKWHANMDTTIDKLKAAPPFTYPAKA